MKAEEAGVGISGGLRKRRESGVGLQGKPGQKMLPEDLRDLLICWKPEGKGSAHASESIDCREGLRSES